MTEVLPKEDMSESESEIEAAPLSLSEYELQRLKNIERNKNNMKMMNLSSYEEFQKAKNIKKREMNKLHSPPRMLFTTPVTTTTSLSVPSRLAFCAVYGWSRTS